MRINAKHHLPLVGTIAAATLLLGACASSPESPSASPETPSLNKAIEAIASQTRELMSKTGVPGVAVAVVHDGKTEYAEGFGIADLSTNAAVDADTVFQLASVSKPVGATVIAKQVSDKAITWDAPVTKSLPDFALKDPWVSEHLTVADLYSHRSGLPDHAGDDLEYLGFDRAQILDRLRYLPLAPFRANYAYTNYGIMVGALATAVASGKEWSALSKDAVYAPLGMDRTTSRYDEYLAFPNHAVGHEKVDGTWRVTPEQLNDDAATAAGGVASSVNDMARWEAMVLGGGSYDGTQLIQSEALQLALFPHNLTTPLPPSIDRPAGQYGYGFGIGVNALGHTVINHSGAFAQGAATFVGMIPASKLGIVVLTNGYPMGVAESIGMQFLDNAEFGEPSQDWWTIYSQAFANIIEDTGTLTGSTPPANPRPAQSLSNYVGTYANPYFGKASITQKDGKLTLRMGPQGQRQWDLNHWDGDTFTFAIGLPEVGPNSISSVIFNPKRKTMVVEFHNSNGLGTFTKSA